MSTEKTIKTPTPTKPSLPEVPVTNDLPYEPNKGRMEHDRN